MNKLLMEENDRLQKQVSQLVCENGYMRQQLQTVSIRACLLFKLLSLLVSLVDFSGYMIIWGFKLQNVSSRKVKSFNLLVVVVFIFGE
jgi:hypothetical protein